MNNNEKIAQYIQNIFHLENLQADDDTYTTGAISSSHWGNGITIRWSIGNRFIDLTYNYSMGTHTCGFGADDTAKNASEEIVKFIGKILISQADSFDPDNWSRNILAWPYNCNLAYVEYVIEALQYGNNPINESRKAVKSGYDNEIYRQAFGALLEDYPPTDTIPGGYRVLVDGNYETEFSANLQEEAIQKFKDYFANKKKGITNSKKSIKSGPDMWAINGMDNPNKPRDIQPNRHNLYDDDDEDNEDDEFEELDSSLTRNQRNLNKFFD